MRLLFTLACTALAFAETLKLPEDFAENLAKLEQAHQAHPQDLQLLDALAGSYAMAADYAKAIGILQQMRSLDPRDRTLDLRLARNYTWAGETSRAIAEYNSYLHFFYLQSGQQDR